MAFLTLSLKEYDTWFLRKLQLHASTFTTEGTNGANVFCLVLKISKIPKISGGEKLNAFFVQNTHEKRTKRFYFRNNCVRKRQKDKIKNYSVWQTTLYLHVAVKKTKETSYFFLVLASTGLEAFFVCLKIDFLPNSTDNFHTKKLSTPIAMQKHLNSPVFWKCSTNFSFIFVIWIETRLKFKH